MPQACFSGEFKFQFLLTGFGAVMLMLTDATHAQDLPAWAMSCFKLESSTARRAGSREQCIREYRAVDYVTECVDSAGSRTLRTRTTFIYEHPASIYNYRIYENNGERVVDPSPTNRAASFSFVKGKLTVTTSDPTVKEIWTKIDAQRCTAESLLVQNSPRPSGGFPKTEGAGPASAEEVIRTCRASSTEWRFQTPNIKSFDSVTFMPRKSAGDLGITGQPKQADVYPTQIRYTLTDGQKLRANFLVFKSLFGDLVCSFQ